MADPRGVADIVGTDIETLPYKADASIVYDRTKSGGSASVGLAVTLTANSTVGLCADGDRVKGRLMLVEWDNFCTVQIGGGCKLPGGNGATLTPGSKIVGALGAAAAKGYIRNVNSAVAAETVKGDHTIYDATDPANVLVNLQD